jgi:hypothetical protein
VKEFFINPKHSSARTFAPSFLPSFLPTFFSNPNKSFVYLHLIFFSFSNTPMASRASESKFDQHRSLTTSADIAASEVTDEGGPSTIISTCSFDNVELTIACRGSARLFTQGSTESPFRKG